MTYPEIAALPQEPWPVVHVRDHDGHRVRIWTAEMERHGQFNVVPLKDVESFKDLAYKLSILAIRVHTCESRADCKCTDLSYGEAVKSAL